MFLPQMSALRRLTRRETLRGMNLALVGARSLLGEARLLKRHGATSRAIALTILSMEETAKVVFLTLFSNPERQSLNQRSLRRLWRIFSSHDGKINLLMDGTWKSILYVRKRARAKGAKDHAVRLLQDFAALDRYLQAGHVTTLTKLKERCLYLDIDPRSAFFVSQFRVPRRITSALVHLAESNIKDAMVLRDSFRRSRTNSLSEAILTVMTRSQVLEQIASDLGI